MMSRTYEITAEERDKGILNLNIIREALVVTAVSGIPIV
jgi:hypothetical protein